MSPTLESTEETWVNRISAPWSNGAPILIEGQALPFAQNRQAKFELELNGIDLTRVDEYSPIPVGIKLVSGFFDAKLLLTFSQIPGEPANLVLTGHTTLRKLEVENQGQRCPTQRSLDSLIDLTEMNLNGAKPSQGRLILTEATVARAGDPAPACACRSCA